MSNHEFINPSEIQINGQELIDIFEGNEFNRAISRLTSE